MTSPTEVSNIGRILMVLLALVTTSSAQQLACANCHGEEAKRVAAPDCGSCHVGTALNNKDALRYKNAFDDAGTPRHSVDGSFAVNSAKTYTTSLGHGGLKCTACHGDPHQQPHMKLTWDCAQCHKVAPTKPDGPHGMHPAGQNWVRAHGLQVDENGASACIGCHGPDGRGTVLSQTFAERSLDTKFGLKHFAKGAAIGCYSCHAASNVP